MAPAVQTRKKRNATQRERRRLPLGRDELDQRFKVQRLHELCRREPLLLPGAGQIELQTLGLRLHADGIAFEGDAPRV